MMSAFDKVIADRSAWRAAKAVGLLAILFEMLLGIKAIVEDGPVKEEAAATLDILPALACVVEGVLLPELTAIILVILAVFVVAAAVVGGEVEVRV